MFKYNTIICKCNNIEHQIIFVCDLLEDDKQVYLNIHLIPERNIFKRIKNAIKYIFGHRSIYGDFDEFILDSSYANELLDIVNYLNPNLLKNNDIIQN